MKQLIYAITLVFILFSSGFSADEKYAIVLGTYSEQPNAERQLQALERHFSSKPELVQLQEANGFDYLNKKVGDYFIVLIQPIEGKEALDTVFGEAKLLFPGLYVSNAGNYIAIEYREPGVAPAEAAEAAAPTAEPAAVAQPEPKPEPAPVAKTPAPKPVAAKTEKVEAATKTAAASKPVPTSAPIVEEVPPAVKPVPRPATASESGMNDMLLYGGAAAVVVLLLILMMMLRRKKPKEVSRIVEEAPAPEAEEPVQLVEVEEEAEAERTIPVETPEEVIELEPEAPVAEEAEVPAAAEPETPVEEVAAAPELPEEKGTPRQKRAYKKGLEPITKESFSLFAGVRILVAEDNLINQKVIAGLLADTGIEIVMANDGKEAVDTLEKDQDFQMVLMDAHMPIMDGFEATAAIRENPLFEKIPVIALSGDTGADDIRKMMEAGMEGTLEKPLHMDALYEMMYNFCDIDIEEEEGDEEEVELLPDTPELHAEKGLEISMGDEALYKEILNEFSQMYGNSDEVLHNYMVKDQVSDANALLLDVHGLAANIGADRLAATSDELREVLMNRDEKRYGELYKEYVAHLKAVLEDIKKI